MSKSDSKDISRNRLINLTQKKCNIMTKMKEILTSIHGPLPPISYNLKQLLKLDVMSPALLPRIEVEKKINACAGHL
jgi:hypothetical protein